MFYAPLSLSPLSERQWGIFLCYYLTVSTNPEYLYGEFRILRAEGKPCPICGHPTGDCSSESTETLHNKNIVGVGLFESLDKEAKIVVEEDVYEERTLYGRQTIKVLKFRKGQQIPISVAREQGLIE